MEHSAYITLDSDAKQRAVYFHDCAGTHEVQAIVEETRRRFTFNDHSDSPFDERIQEEAEIKTFYTILYGVIREYKKYYSQLEGTQVFLINNIEVLQNTRNDYKFVVDKDYFCDAFFTEYTSAQDMMISNIRVFFSTSAKLHKGIRKLIGTLTGEARV